MKAEIRALREERDNIAKRCLELQLHNAKLWAALEEIVEYNRGDVPSPEGEIARRALLEAK
jgi:hypothetical protein